MPRLATLSEINRQATLSFPCLEPDTTPWSPLGKPLSQAKISLGTSAGLHLRHDQPFIGDPKGGDTSYRIIPSTAEAGDILQSHVSIGFDHTAIMRDR
jgi:D-proline reductase (dithiol) PrdB